MEQVHVQLLKLGMHQGLRQIIAILEGLNFKLGAHLAGQYVLGLPQHGWSAISYLFLDGLWLIHDNYPSSIPPFYIVWDTLRNLT